MRAWLLVLVLVTGCPEKKPDPAPAPPATPPADCLAATLAAAGLNAFGDAPGTVYAGGTPLFDERSGYSVDLRTYVARRHPEIVARCPAPQAP